MTTLNALSDENRGATVPPRVVVADHIAHSGVALLRGRFEVDVATEISRNELLKRCGEAQALIVRSATCVDAEMIAAAPRLKVIGRAGAGLDNVDLEAASAVGIEVINTPDANTVSAAEHTMALLLAVARDVPQAHYHVRSGQWDRSAFVGVELARKTLAVLGLGRIGRTVAQRANAFGMRVVGYDPCQQHLVAHPATTMNDWVDMRLSIRDAVRDADFVTIHMPLTADTDGLIDARMLAAMPFGVRLINTARGAIIKEGDLLEALRSRQVSAAALDVFANEPVTDRRLIRHPRVIATPHIAASTTDAQDRAGLQVAEAVADVLAKTAT